MGYSYNIVLQIREQNEWKIVDSYSNNGSFNCEDQHYFLTHIGSDNFFHKDSSGYTYYVFSASTVLKDYNKYKIREWKDIMKETIDSSKTPEEAMEAIQGFDCESFQRPSFWTELGKWGYQIMALKEDIDNIRIIFEIAV